MSILSRLRLLEFPIRFWHPPQGCDERIADPRPRCEDGVSKEKPGPADPGEALRAQGSERAGATWLWAAGSGVVVIGMASRRGARGILRRTVRQPGQVFEVAHDRVFGDPELTS